LIASDAHADGAILPVRARAGARRNGIQGEHAGALQVSVTQAPEKGKANKAIVSVLAESLGLRKCQIELITGETSPQKRFLVRGVTQLELAERIRRVLERLESDRG
jgi:uncharacterized protein